MSAADERVLSSNPIPDWIEASDLAGSKAIGIAGQVSAFAAFGQADTGDANSILASTGGPTLASVEVDPATEQPGGSVVSFDFMAPDHFDFAASLSDPLSDLPPISAGAGLGLPPADAWNATPWQPAALEASLSLSANRSSSAIDSHAAAPAALRGGGAAEGLASKLDGLLVGLATKGSGHTAALPGSIVDGKYVIIDATAKDGDGAALLAKLEDLGLRHGAAFGGVASGEVPIDKLGALAAVADLAFAHEDALVTSRVTLPPQAAWAAQAVGLTVTGTNGKTHVIDGTGIKIGILSDSFDTAGGSDTMQTDIANGYLPANTEVLSDYPGGTDEGRAMAQIVHEIAPGASILFASAFYGEASFASQIIALAYAGAKVIVDDVGYFDEPAYQDGVIAQAVDYVTSHFGVAYFSAAGNDGSNGYEGAFHKGHVTRKETFNNFTPGHGQHDSLPVTVPAGDEVIFVLQWAQPAASASPGHGARSRLDLILTNGHKTVAQSADHTVGRDPVQEIDFVNGAAHSRTLYLYVGRHAGPIPADFKLMALDNGGGVTLGDYASNRNHGTIYGHPAASGAVSVGADFIGDTPAYGTNPPVSEYYSSTGPTNIWFNPDGTALAHPDVRSGPDLMAPDGADTSFLGFQINDGDSFPNFFGTSAAAPAAAAVAALVLQTDPLLTAGEAVDIMKITALDQPDSHGGLIQANAAVDAAWTLYS